jgi:hypothetical protein
LVWGGPGGSLPELVRDPPCRLPPVPSRGAAVLFH